MAETGGRLCELYSKGQSKTARGGTGSDAFTVLHVSLLSKINKDKVSKI